jgi:hypothetical protein
MNFKVGLTLTPLATGLCNDIWLGYRLLGNTKLWKINCVYNVNNNMAAAANKQKEKTGAI